MSSPAGSSDLSEPPSPAETDIDDSISTPGPSSRPSVDLSAIDNDQSPHHHHPAKRRKLAAPPSLLSLYERKSFEPWPPGTPLPDDPLLDADNISLSSDGYSSAPGSPSHGEYAMRDDAQTTCLWKDCDFGDAVNNDELVKHVQATHCATGGPKRTKYVCEWGECQRKTSNHPSGYALKAHMRSHTKEKPYYCALPECDKAFTRSDALAKHMRTVHEPEPVKGAATTIAEVLVAGKPKGKGRTANGTPNGRSTTTPAQSGVIIDEYGNEVSASPANDNISYRPAHHPVTGQPGFMIHYPPDIHFTTFESAIPADSLMRLLRRQLHWAQKDGEALQREIDELEQIRKEEWIAKELLLEGLMEVELARVDRDGLLEDVGPRVLAAMEKDARRDVPASKRLQWSGGPPEIQPRRRCGRRRPAIAPPAASTDAVEASADADVEADVDVDADEPDDVEPLDTTMIDADSGDDGAQSPLSPTGNGGGGGGFDGDADPYDNYLAERMAAFEERERLRSMQNTPLKDRDADERRAADEADAVGALLGMSSGAD